MRVFVLLFLSLLLFLIGSISCLYLKKDFVSWSPELGPVIFRIDENEKLVSISRRLKGKNLIISSKLFEFGARYKRLDKIIRYGEFVLERNMSTIDILKKFTTNEVLNYKVVIRECTTNWEIIELFNQKYFLSNDLSHVDLDEGAYAPNTYFIGYNTKFSELLQLLQQQQTEILENEWINRQKEIPIEDQLGLLTLASMIEKEAATIFEMPIISSVFMNRLNIGMRLQSDPTVSYGLDFGNIDNRKKLTKNDLKIRTEHNTYQISGLPASPICNPSKSAIAAAANPADTNYLYFVLNESGNHSFAETFQEHKQNVLQWRLTQKK